MATQPALEVSYTGVLNKVGDTMTLTNDTGSDNTATSTKYSSGTTNHNSLTSNNYITEFIFTKPDGTEITLRYNRAIALISLTASSTAPIPYNGTELELESSDLGLSDTLFDDGVYTVKVREWYPIYGNGSNYIKVTTDLYTITDDNGDCDFNSSNNRTTQGLVDADYVMVVLQGDFTKRNIREFTIDSISQITLSTSLTSDFAVNDWVYLLAGYEKTIGILADKNFLKCFQPKIAKISVEEDSACCDKCGQTKIDELFEIFEMVFGYKAQFDLGMFEESNKNIQALLKMCQNIECSSCD